MLRKNGAPFLSYLPSPYDVAVGVQLDGHPIRSEGRNHGIGCVDATCSDERNTQRGPLAVNDCRILAQAIYRISEGV